MSLTRMIFKNLLVVFALSIVFLESLYAEGITTKTTTKEYQGIGEGHSRQEAINNALAEAISQINGVTLSKKQLMQSSLVTNDQGSTLNENHNSRIESITKGKVDTYTIEDVSENNGLFQARILVKKSVMTHSYREPGLGTNSRRKIIITPFYALKSSFVTPKGEASAQEISYKMTQATNNHITQTRRFVVLDRENQALLEYEKAFMSNKNADPKERARLGKALGADYIFVADIQEFDVKNLSQTSSLTGQTSSAQHINASIQYKIIMVSSGQVKWSSTINISHSLGSGDKNPELSLQEALDEVAQRIGYEIIENIYPIAISSISSSGEIILNQGGATIRTGDRFEVFLLGKMLYDKYTKEPLGRDEILQGVVEITRVLPKVSYAKSIEGSNMGEEMILRRIQEHSAHSNQKGKAESQATINSDGTIKLW